MMAWLEIPLEAMLSLSVLHLCQTGILQIRALCACRDQCALWRLIKIKLCLPYDDTDYGLVRQRRAQATSIHTCSLSISSNEVVIRSCCWDYSATRQVAARSAVRRALRGLDGSCRRNPVGKWINPRYDGINNKSCRILRLQISIATAKSVQSNTMQQVLQQSRLCDSPPSTSFTLPPPTTKKQRCYRHRHRQDRKASKLDASHVDVAAVEDVVAPRKASRLPPLPFVKVAGQEEMKLALLLNVVDPRIGGVLIMGDRGTGKSVAVRHMACTTSFFRFCNRNHG